MPREIERKYLVVGEGWRETAGAGVSYRQGYLSLDPDRSVRVRLAGGKAFLTIKGRSEGAGRDEFEYSIPPEDAGHMLQQLCLQPVIEKKRFRLPAGSLTWEIDEFGGENQGLIVAEIEIPNDEHSIPKPDWVGREVTGDPRYYNLHLVGHPYSQWK